MRPEVVLTSPGGSLGVSGRTGEWRLWNHTGFCARAVGCSCPWGALARYPSVPAPCPCPLPFGARPMPAPFCGRYSFATRSRCVLLLARLLVPRRAPTRRLPVPALCSYPFATRARLALVPARCSRLRVLVPLLLCLLAPLVPSHGSRALEAPPQIAHAARRLRKQKSYYGLLAKRYSPLRRRRDSGRRGGGGVELDRAVERDDADHFAAVEAAVDLAEIALVDAASPSSVPSAVVNWGTTVSGLVVSMSKSAPGPTKYESKPTESARRLGSAARRLGVRRHGAAALGGGLRRHGDSARRRLDSARRRGDSARRRGCGSAVHGSGVRTTAARHWARRLRSRRARAR